MDYGIVNDETLKKLADAIRKRTGLTRSITLQEMPGLIRGLTIIEDQQLKQLIEHSVNTFEIPNSVTKIGSGVFKEWNSLQGITIPNSVTSIINTAFTNCPNLTTINVAWPEGTVTGAPWGATNAVINYNYIKEEIT